MQEAMELFKNSKVARASFGDAVVDHYLHYAKNEIQAFNSAITDWERVRGFERT
jgi:glutamine synthetase